MLIKPIMLNIGLLSWWDGCLIVIRHDRVLPHECTGKARFNVTETAERNGLRISIFRNPLGWWFAQSRLESHLYTYTCKDRFYSWRKASTPCFYIWRRNGPKAGPPSWEPLNPAVSGLRATHQLLWGTCCPLYFSDDIVTMWRDKEAKICTHISEQIAVVVSKLSVSTYCLKWRHSDVRNPITDWRFLVSWQYIRNCWSIWIELWLVQNIVEILLRCVRITAGAVKYIYRRVSCIVPSETPHIGKQQHLNDTEMTSTVTSFQEQLQPPVFSQIWPGCSFEAIPSSKFICYEVSGISHKTKRGQFYYPHPSARGWWHSQWRRDLALRVRTCRARLYHPINDWTNCN